MAANRFSGSGNDSSTIPFKVFEPEPEFEEMPAFVPVQQRTSNPLSLAGQRIASQFSDVKVSDEDRRRAMTEMTTVEFYSRWMEKDRRKELDPKTVKIDGDALAWFSGVGVPEDWPDFEAWDGPPIGCITSSWIESLVEESLMFGLAVNTVGKYLRHLRTIWNEAARLGLIRKLSITVPTEEPEARPFSEAEVERIYRGLAEHPALQVAFVLALATGARFGDLFWLTWDQIDLERRQIDFTAQKTDKHQVVPLAAVPLKHLMRLPRDQAPFAELVDQSIEPDFRSEHYQSRRINARWRCLTGFPAPPRLKKLRPPNCVAHPWHSARSTAAIWIEQVAAGMASRLLGHSIQGDKSNRRQRQGEKTTRRHYLVPLVPQDLRDAANAVAWPAYFDQIMEPRQMRLF